VKRFLIFSAFFIFLILFFKQGSALAACQSITPSSFTSQSSINITITDPSITNGEIYDIYIQPDTVNGVCSGGGGCPVRVTATQNGRLTANFGSLRLLDGRYTVSVKNASQQAACITNGALTVGTVPQGTCGVGNNGTCVTSISQCSGNVNSNLSCPSSFAPVCCTSGAITPTPPVDCSKSNICCYCGQGDVYGDSSNGFSQPVCIPQDGSTRYSPIPAGSNGVCPTGKTCDHTLGCVTTINPGAPSNPFLLTPAPKIPCDSANLKGGCDRVSTAFGTIGTNLPELVRSLFRAVLSISGVLAVILIIISGYRLMTSQGNPEQVQNAREQLTAAIVGLAFVIFSLVILQFIGVNLLGLPGFG
jgi:hypothetical protein